MDFRLLKSAYQSQLTFLSIIYTYASRHRNKLLLICHKQFVYWCQKLCPFSKVDSPLSFYLNGHIN